MNTLIRLLRLDFLPTCTSFALLILRVALGAQMLTGHGWGKLMSFSEMAQDFSDPLGVGSTTSLALAIIGEVLCSALLTLGLFTPLAALGRLTDQ